MRSVNGRSNQKRESAEQARDVLDVESGGGAHWTGAPHIQQRGADCLG